MSETTREARPVFVTTHWTEIVHASQGASPALETLCRKYWYPLYAFVRRQGYGTHDAEDLTQAFFERFLDKEYLADVNPARGKFRSFLLASLKHFLANEWDRARAKKRGSGQCMVSLDVAEARYAQEPSTEAEPERIYDRRWALTILDQALAALQCECEAEGKDKQFELLKQSLMRGEVANDLNLSRGAAKVAAHRMRRRFRELLRSEIEQTVSSRAEIDEEMRYLFSVISL